MADLHEKDFKDLELMTIVITLLPAIYLCLQSRTKQPQIQMFPVANLQETCCIDMQEISGFEAYEISTELDELSSFFRQRIGCAPVTVSREPRACRKALVEQREASLVSEPERLLRTSDQISSTPRPKRFHRTFWRGIVRRALAHYCEIKTL